jgi:hypothetical protein
MMKRNFNKTWKRYQFKFLVALSFIFLMICYFFLNETGTYSNSITYDPNSFIKYNNNNNNIISKPFFVTESKGEKACREYLQKTFMRPFPNQRPAFLYNNVTGNNLEIDCYNEELKLGVEYNGKQHYNYVKGMHKNMDAFRNQQYRDEMKMRLCRENGVNLIIIPYSIPTESIGNYLRENLITLGYLK